MVSGDEEEKVTAAAVAAAHETSAVLLCSSYVSVLFACVSCVHFTLYEPLRVNSHTTVLYCRYHIERAGRR